MRSPHMLLTSLEKNDPRFTDADFSNMSMEDDDFERLFQIIKKNKIITSLCLLETGIQEKHIPSLHEALLKNIHITDFSIQKYKDYSAKTLKLIQEMVVHVENNAPDLVMRI
ncbi:Uncharacterised protein [Legionella wadsworthii]|uniref:Uncharacterized protein n=1 Tax=Legionella wadsworthii TaxID=28088 RepID=A0A378LUJ7_9GAMM|nr:hypothetical protein [Legionella wadsworthii]STY29502.1 Uncharacterised protein [Legionella wadsworthii]